MFVKFRLNNKTMWVNPLLVASVEHTDGEEETAIRVVNCESFVWTTKSSAEEVVKKLEEALEDM